MLDGLVVLESARRHDVAKADMLHAIEHALKVVPQDDGVAMYVGPARSGHQMLEIGVVTWHGLAAINHAMPARPRYL